MKINFFRIKDVINKNAKSFVGRLLLFLSVLGPGLITANIDNDAGGIATYSMTGALTGYRLLWTLLPITIALIFVQEMCSRMGIVSGKGLADLIREKFGLKITFYILIFLIIADFGNTTAEFAGIASAGEIFGISKYFSVPLCALLVWLFVVKGDYKIVERFFLVGCTLYISYIICGFITNPPWREVITNLYSPNPTEFKSTDLPMIVGLIGTTITPWMQFYLQAAIVEKGLRTENLMLSRLDVIFGCLFIYLSQPDAVPPEREALCQDSI